MGRIVETSSVRLHRVDHGGEGLPIVLVHGLGGSTADWDAVAPALTEIGRVIALDLPKFGFFPPAGEDGLDAMTAALVGFLEEVVEEAAGAPAVLIGNSMGGLVSTLIAGERPDLVAALVLVAPAFPPRLSDLNKVHWPTAFRLIVQTAPLSGEALAAWLHRLDPRERVSLSLEWVAHKSGRIPMPVIESLIEVSDRRSKLPWTRSAVTATSRSIAGLWLRPRRLIKAVRAVQAPTLVVQGSDDRIVPPSAVEGMCRRRSDWVQVSMVDTGHVPQLDAPFRFLDVVVPWLGAKDFRPVR